jgi:DNA-binding response OmpR family regulator
MEDLDGRQRIHAGCWVDWDRKGVWRHQRFERLPARTFRLLTCLLQHHDHVVSISTLLSVGWPEDDRSPQDLYPYIHHLRQIIEPTPTQPQWLLTWYGYGYLLHLAPPTPHRTSSAS